MLIPDRDSAARDLMIHVNFALANRMMGSGGSSGYQNGQGFVARIFAGFRLSGSYGEVGVMRKRHKKTSRVDPKVFFANERTFMAWMHVSVMLAGASIAILAFTEDQNPLQQLYGVVLLPVAICFIVYSMQQHSRRARMLRHRHPCKNRAYDDTVGPIVFGVMLIIAITAQISLRLYAMNS